MSIVTDFLDCGQSVQQLYHMLKPGNVLHYYMRLYCGIDAALFIAVSGIVPPVHHSGAKIILLVSHKTILFT